MIQRFEALSSGLGDLSQFGRIPEQKQRCLPPMTHYNQSDLPQECFTNYPYVQAVQNNFNSFRSSANVCLTSNSHPSFENNLSVNQHRQSFNIFERINSFPRYANRRNFEEPCSRSSTSHSNTYEEINVNIRRLTSDNRDNFQTLPKNNPFPHPASSHAFTSQCNNQFTPLKPQSLEQQVLLKKLTDLGSWLIKNNKLDSDRTMAPCILDSAMYEFGLNIKFTWLPNKRMMLLCSLGSSDVMIYNQPYSEKHSAEQIACHSTLEKLTKPCLNIVSQEGYLDMLTISNLPIDKSEQVNKNEFSILEKGETIHKAITSNEFLPDNSIELQNQLLLWTPQFSVSNLSIYLLTFQDIYQLKHLSQQSKHLGILEKLIILGKWLLEKHEFDLSKFSLSDLLNSAMCYFDLSLKYNYLPGNSKSFQKVMVFCSLGKTNVLICSSNFRQNENPKQLVCLKAIEKLTQPFLAISRVEGSIDQLIDSNFSIVGNYIGGNYNAINCILAAPKPPETPKSPEYSKSSANDNKRKPGKNARRRLSKRMRIMKKLEMGKMNEIEVKKTKLENIEDKANKNEGNFKKKMDENLANIGEEKNKNNIEEQKSENLFNIGEKSKNKMCIVEQKSENLLNISEKIENKMEIVEQNNENNINIKEDQKSENLLNISEKIENKMNIVEQKSENLLNISEENGNKRNTEEQKSENLVLFGEKNDENKRNIEEQKSDNLMQVESKEIDNLNIDEKRNKDMEEKNNQDCVPPMQLEWQGELPKMETTTNITKRRNKPGIRRRRQRRLAKLQEEKDKQNIKNMQLSNMLIKLEGEGHGQ